MIIENNALKGIKSELSHLDDVSSRIGFIRNQWEYTRATYDYKITYEGQDYYLRLDTRAVEGKLEQPHAVLQVGDAYIGRATFPHGLSYNESFPAHVLKAAESKLAELANLLK
jgi:hypothetical protein